MMNAPTGLQRARHLAQRGVLVRHKVEHTIGDDHVCPAVLNWQGLTETLAKLNVIHSRRRGAGACFENHSRRHVDADNATLRTDYLRGDEAVDTATAADID